MGSHKYKNTISYKLGVMIGEFIYYRYLPTLSIDDMQSPHVITVSDEETIEYERLHNLWWPACLKSVQTGENELAFETMRTYTRSLEKKYFPKILECGIPVDLSKIKNLDDVKYGIKDSLWDCDVCAYHIDIDEIIITKAPKYYWYKTSVTLELGIKE